MNELNLLMSITTQHYFHRGAKQKAELAKIPSGLIPCAFSVFLFVHVVAPTSQYISHSGKWILGTAPHVTTPPGVTGFLLQIVSWK